MQGSKDVIAYLVAVKLVVVPGVAFMVARAYSLVDIHFNALLVLAALPTATNAYILTTRMGGDGGLVASVVTTNILAAMVTLPLWLSAAGL